MEKSKRPTPAEMILIFNWWLLFNGYVLTSWNWEKIEWGTWGGGDRYTNCANGRLLHPKVMTLKNE